MKPDRIRPLALAVIQHENQLFVAENYDRFKQQTFYRPLGGRIEFGEYGHQTVGRELMEEIGQPLTDIAYLGLVENLFTYGGRSGHEIVLLYTARFADPALYAPTVSLRGEDHGRLLFVASWQPFTRFTEGDTPLYPTGLLEMLVGHSE